MRIKKMLAALGLVCVVAPAALAASMIINRGGGDPAEGPARGPVEAMLGSLLEMMRSPGEIGEGKIPHRASPGNGKVALPFRPANVLAPDLAHLMEWEFGDKAFEDVVAASFPGGAVGATGGPVGTQSPGAPQNGSQGVPSFASGGAGNGFGGIGGFGGFGGAGGSGAGGSDGSAADLALAVHLSDPPATDGATGEPFASMPLPASVWMLMASMAGLAFLGLRRRSRPV